MDYDCNVANTPFNSFDGTLKIEGEAITMLDPGQIRRDIIVPGEKLPEQYAGTFKAVLRMTHMGREVECRQLWMQYRLESCYASCQ